MDALSIVHNENGQGGVGNASAVLSNGVFTLKDVPAPGAGALVGLAGLTAMRRRR